MYYYIPENMFKPCFHVAELLGDHLAGVDAEPVA